MTTGLACVGNLSLETKIPSVSIVTTVDVDGLEERFSREVNRPRTTSHYFADCVCSDVEARATVLNLSILCSDGKTLDAAESITISMYRIL